MGVDVEEKPEEEDDVVDAEETPEEENDVVDPEETPEENDVVDVEETSEEENDVDAEETSEDKIVDSAESERSGLTLEEIRERISRHTQDIEELQKELGSESEDSADVTNLEENEAPEELENEEEKPVIDAM